MAQSKKGMLFEAVAVLLLILLLFLMLVMITTGDQQSEWTKPGVIIPPQATISPLVARSNMFVGSDDTLYTIDGHNIYAIVPYRGDDRYVRYFTNSGTYGEEEQMAMALVRRDNVRKVLSVLIKKPDIMIGDLTRESGLQASAASRYMKELGEKGVVSKKRSEDGRLSYSIENKYGEPIGLAIERLESLPESS